MTLPRRLNLWLETAKSAVFIDYYQLGAGGGTRTRTTFYGPRILSPVRLPFRHTGKFDLQRLIAELRAGT